MATNDSQDSGPERGGKRLPSGEDFAHFEAIPGILCVYLCVIRRKSLIISGWITGSNPVSRTSPPSFFLSFRRSTQ